MTTVEIRDARPGDLADWMTLWEGYLTFYKVTIEPDVTANTWARILDPMNLLTCRVALVGGKMAGFANFHTHLTTWDKRPVCYLEDLFVSPSARGLGIGRQLIDDMIRIGKENDWASVYWITAEDNKTAQKLYDTYNKRDAFIRYSVAL